MSYSRTMSNLRFLAHIAVMPGGVFCPGEPLVGDPHTIDDAHQLGFGDVPLCGRCIGHCA